MDLIFYRLLAYLFRLGVCFQTSIFSKLYYMTLFFVYLTAFDINDDNDDSGSGGAD